PEVRPAVEREEPDPRQAERDHHRRPVRPGGDGGDGGVREERDVEPGGLLGLVVEPQERGDLLADHEFPPRRGWFGGRFTGPPRDACHVLVVFFAVAALRVRISIACTNAWSRGMIFWRIMGLLVGAGGSVVGSA